MENVASANTSSRDLNPEDSHGVFLRDLLAIIGAERELVEQSRPERHWPERVISAMHHAIHAEEGAAEVQRGRRLANGVDVELADVVARSTRDVAGRARSLHAGEVVDTAQGRQDGHAR